MWSHDQNRSELKVNCIHETTRIYLPTTESVIC